MYFSTKVLKHQQIQHFFSTKTVASETKYLPDEPVLCSVIITGFPNDTTEPSIKAHHYALTSIFFLKFFKYLTEVKLWDFYLRFGHSHCTFERVSGQR